MDADNNNGTTISTCSTFQTDKSSVTGKSVYESNEDEFIQEMFRQLKLSFPSLPQYDKAIIHPSVTRNGNMWVEDDSAFIGLEYVPSNISKNLWYVGTQNGHSYYNFTTMESAVTNALFVLNDMEGVNVKIESPLELITVIRILILFILLIVLLLILK